MGVVSMKDRRKELRGRVRIGKGKERVAERR